MDIRQITPAYAVSPQIDPSDLPAIAAAGFTRIICNRPDGEIPPALQATGMEAAAKDAGLEFVCLPAVHSEIGPRLIDAQMEAISGASGPVLAYCASGTRSSILWALGQAGLMDGAEILEATSKAGYDLSALAPQLAALSRG